jgi:hypothetical protein
VLLMNRAVCLMRLGLYALALRDLEMALSTTTFVIIIHNGHSLHNTPEYREIMIVNELSSTV